MAKELEPIQVRPKIHDLSLIKQIIESRTNSLDILREALSNMCTPEVGATRVEVLHYLDPEYGGTFVFKDNGCGMEYTGREDQPGRLDRFINLGYGGAAGLSSDKYGWKGLGSKLILNCRRLEVTTWTGIPSSPINRIEVNEPRGKLLQDKPEWPTFYRIQRDSEGSDSKGTTVKVFGFDGGLKNYSIDELQHYMYWNTIVGITRPEPGLPEVFLKVGNVERQLELGYKWIQKKTDLAPGDAWKTVLVDPPIMIDEQTKQGQKVRVTLKGGFTLNTANACGPGIGLSKHRHNTGLRLSVLGIPFFRLEDFYSLKGNKFQQYKDLCSFVVECDELATKLNIDRSMYNRDDDVAQVFERAVSKAFDKFSETNGYRNFFEMLRKEDEKTKSSLLNKRKKELNSPGQEFVVVENGEEGMRVVHRVPNNEHDTLALFWKLEGMKLIPYEKFDTLEHTNQSGIDVIANYQEFEDSQMRLMEAVEFEFRFENFNHNPKQTGIVVCWEVKFPNRHQKVNNYTYRGQIGTDVFTVSEIRNYPGIKIARRSNIE